ncbi:hypothetical protein STSV1pORF71 [Sulfolobus virus STSV1]|uniref:hypothetical protein n=1 Tax=Sulfolobus virus STSV1 TaxID=285013 RepID=UPI000042B135|nr:hypothetical protein STSV1pORF71 [Sulfolobus virus STSV1]CAH04254.1 hypothetical protein [Sulfolobus virus STSV1]
MKEKDLEENKVYNEEDNTDFANLKDVLSDNEFKELNRLSKKADRLSTEADDTCVKIFDSITDLRKRLNEEKVPEAEIINKINEIIEMLKQVDRMELEFIETTTKIVQVILDAEMRMVKNAASSTHINENKIKEAMNKIEDQKNTMEKMYELLIRINDTTKELINIMEGARQNVSQRLELLEQAIEVFRKRDEISDEVDKLLQIEEVRR